MKNRILQGWTITRALYLLMGGAVAVQSIMENQWWGIVFGAYFAAMGVFNFGCAAGCSSGACYNEPSSDRSGKIQDIQFEEVKSK